MQTILTVCWVSHEKLLMASHINEFQSPPIVCVRGTQVIIILSTSQHVQKKFERLGAKQFGFVLEEPIHHWSVYGFNRMACSYGYSLHP